MKRRFMRGFWNRRALLLALFGTMTVVGFGMGFAHLHHHRSCRHAELERVLAERCVNAAFTARDGRAVSPERGHEGRHGWRGRRMDDLLDRATVRCTAAALRHAPPERREHGTHPHGRRSHAGQAAR